MAPDMIANRYQMLQTLGEGAMGLVSRVLDTTTGQEVALKVISHAYGADESAVRGSHRQTGGATDAASAPHAQPSEKSVLQFKQEFRLMTQLRHPNCCAVYDFGVLSDGSPYFTMEVLPGQGLDELAPVDHETFRHVMTQLLLALGYIHQLGFVHLDVKSENVRVRPDASSTGLPTVKLMDYGLMEYARRPTGFINGTLAYIAPEVIRRGAIDQRTDLYSLGVLAYEMLTGRVPFDGANARDILQAHIAERPKPPSELREGLDPAYEQIVLKLLAKNPIDRFQSAYQVLEALGVDVPAGIGGNLLTSPLMAREHEMEVLAERLAALVAGEPGGNLLIHGPPGIGKSRLVEEFRFTVQLASLPCVVGQNFEQGNAPYQPIVTILKMLLPAFKQHIPEHLAVHGPILAKLLPDLGMPPARDLDSPTKEKLRLQATITELFSALASRLPFVVIIEDWQWSDTLSVELVDYVLRNIQQAPMLLIQTSHFVPESPPAHMDLLSLGHLDESGVARMITSMLGTDEIGETFQAELVGLSKGNPFFVERLLEHLVQSQVLVNTRGVWNTDVELAAERLPKNLTGLLMWRITCLPEAAQAIAHVAAVMGRLFTIDHLKLVADVAEDELFAALGSLSHNQVLAHDEGGAYSFAQDQIQEVLYANVEPGEKSAIHTKAAEALEADQRQRLEHHGGHFPADVPLDQITAIAEHYLHGTRREKTIEFALEAGRRSAALFANAEAEHFLSAGLALVKAMAPTGRHRRYLRLEYLSALGDLRLVTSKNDAAKECYQEAIPLAEDLGENFRLGRMLTWLGRCHQVLVALPDALHCSQRSLSVCLKNGDEAGGTRCLIQMARIQYFMGDMGRAIDYAEQALALARKIGSTGLIGESQSIMGYFYVASDPDMVEEGVAHMKEAQACLSELGDWIALNTTYNFLGTAQNMLGDHLDAWHSFQQIRKITHEIGAHDELVFALLNLAITAFELGEFKEMKRFAAEARVLAAQHNSRYPQGMAITLAAVAAAFTDEFANSRALIEEALALARELKHKYMETQVLLYQVQILLYLGHLTEARQASEALARLITQTGDREPEARLNVYRAEILGRQGDLDSARAYLDRALLPAVTGRAQGMQVRVLTIMAWLALGEEAWTDARNVAIEALGMSLRVGTKFQTAWLHLILGEVALSLGDEPAGPHFDAVAAIAAEIGSPVLLAQALFGRAAAAPTGIDARKQAMQARALVEDLLLGQNDQERACFFSFPERNRLLDGDFYAFGTPIQERGKGAPRLGLNPGLWKAL